MNIKKQINNAKNKCIAKMSKVIEVVTDEKQIHYAEPFLGDFCSSNSDGGYDYQVRTGRPLPRLPKGEDGWEISNRKIVKPLTLRKIANGSDIYSVSDVITAYDKRERATVADDKYPDHEFCELQRKERTINVDGKKGSVDVNIYDQVVSTNTRESVFNEKSGKFVQYGEAKMALSADTDLSDNNAIRYQIRDNQALVYFFDKFVIITPAERAFYKEYEKTQLQKITIAKEAKKQQELATKREKEKILKERAVAEKQSAKKQLKADKITQKVKTTFFGR